MLDAAGPEAPTLVEFLDFECPSCATLHPTVTALRAQYEGKINFVVRHFPLPGHSHAMDAAPAAEAAGQQGRFEDMYLELFENQKAWSARTESQSGTFRGYADELGLDLVAYDAAIADPATLERIRVDIDDAQRVGAQGTPTFVLDGEVLQLEKLSDLTDALDRALARQ
ncbi:DsbA family protein [Pseudoclavibacter helvolus]|uniref:DsbA family protein n=1 Tax=Pseudoclavibacter helvolus TaxID=255205 RepID=UPI003C734659